MKNARLFYIFFLMIGVSAFCVRSVAYAADKKEDKKNIDGTLGFKKPSSNAPIEITSDSLSANASTRIFSYKGSVVVTQEDLRVTADQVNGKYNDKNEMETIVCEGNVVITKGETLRAKSQLAVYNVKTGIMELTESPEVMQETNILTADKILVFVNEDRSEAHGNVQVKVVNSSQSKSLLSAADTKTNGKKQ